MKVDWKDIACCVAILISLSTGTSAAEDGYIFGKEEDRNLLNLSIVFLVMCVLFLLVSLLTALMLMKKTKRPGEAMEYDLEQREGRYQSMSAGNSDNRHPPRTSIAHYESLQMNGSGGSHYQSLDSNGTYDSVNYEQPNGHAKAEQDTPPGSGRGQKTLSSFQNPAYEVSMPSGLNKEVEIKPATANAGEEDTPL